MFDYINNITLPLSDPTQIFLLVLIIILAAPLLHRIKIPHIIGLIAAGMIFGPYGLNILSNDASFELFGKVGILYIMFLASLNIDMNSFKQNSQKGIVFGLLSLIIPIIIGVLSGIYILKLPILSALLISSMYASHTLIAYPIVSQLGVSHNRSVSILITGTIIAVATSLLMLAVIIAGASGDLSQSYWIKFGIGTSLFLIITFFIFPRISKFLLSRFNNNVSQYIYVMLIVFLTSLLAQCVGLEGILGAFFAGLVLNRLIPNNSALMTRIEFVGNAIFIPFFLISVGMLINLRVLFSSWESLMVAITMSVVAVSSKWIVAKISQAVCRLSTDEGNMIFGLSSGKAAGSLAVAMIGFNLGLLSENILNGTVIMIFIACATSSIVTERAARRIALKEKEEHHNDLKITTVETRPFERILISISNPATMPSLIELSSIIKTPREGNTLYALSNINGNIDAAKKLMSDAMTKAESINDSIVPIFKDNINVTNGIIEAIEENAVTDVIVGIHAKANFIDTFFGPIITNLVNATAHQTFFIYSPKRPVSETRKLYVAVPDKAEHENGFHYWFNHINNIAKKNSMEVRFFASYDTTIAIQQLATAMESSASITYEQWNSFDDFELMAAQLSPETTVAIISSRRNSISYAPQINKLPYHISKHLSSNNFMIIYPQQTNINNNDGTSYNILTVHNE